MTQQHVLFEVKPLEAVEYSALLKVTSPEQSRTQSFVTGKPHLELDIITKNQTSYLVLDLIKHKNRESHMTKPLKSFLVHVLVAVTRF